MERNSYITNKDDSCLVVVDVQEKLHPFVQKKDETKGKIIKLIRTAKLFSMPVLITEHYPKGLGRTIEEIQREVEGVPKIEKVTFSCGRTEKFLEKLNSFDRKKIILCGMETHICVAQTAFDLLGEGYRVFVVADAVSSRNNPDHEIGIERMKGAGVTITTSEAVMYELMEEAGTPLFKEFLKIVKD